MSKLITNSEFETAIRMLPRALKPANVSIARAVLVEGQKQTDLVRETGLSRSSISALVNKVRRSYKKNALPPDGWERIEVCLPKQMVSIVRALEVEARKDYNDKV